MSDRLAKLHKLLALDERDTFTLYALAQEHAKARSQQALGELAAGIQPPTPLRPI